MSKRKTTAEFKQEVYNLVGNEYSVLGEYKTANTVIKLRHNVCNYEWDTTTPHRFLAKGARCPQCSKHIRMTLDSFKELVKNRTHGSWYVKESYIDHFRNNTKTTLIHRICGKPYEITPKSFKQNGIKCRYCQKVAKEKELLKANYKKEQSLINGITPAQYRQRKELAKKRQKTTEDFKKELYKLVGDEYTVLGTYTRSNKPIKIRHNKCGREYHTTRSHFIEGERCKCEHISKGEALVKSYLFEHGVEYQYAYVLFNGLHLDFYISAIHLGIEYDGIQHYKPRELFGGVKAFKNQKRNDLIKDKYCKDHNISLVRIPYTVRTIKGIDKILSEYIK